VRLDGVSPISSLRPSGNYALSGVGSEELRVHGRWGLYYYRGPAAFGPSSATNVKPSTVPIKDAPLAVRERFLRHAEAFFSQYIKMAESRLTQVKASVEGGDAALRLLESLKLD
jgi:hypothetical protein